MTPIEEELTDVLSDFYNLLKEEEYGTTFFTPNSEEYQEALDALYNMCSRYFHD